MSRPASTAAPTASACVEAAAFAPASVGNIGVGFDLLGHSIAGPGDIARVRRSAAPGVRITTIGGIAEADHLPREATRNTAGRALLELLAVAAPGFGFELALEKGIPLGSGLGGSAASCVAALVAANALLPAPLSREALYPLALDGESVASGSRHGDNVAPMLFGGIVLATTERALPLSCPLPLVCAVVHPDQVLETRRARDVLAAPYPLAEVVRHSGHLALFLTGLQRGDAALIRAGLHDVLVEPRRAALIPGFADVKAAALDHGALGASISGAGPSVFGWFLDQASAERAAAVMQAAFAAHGSGSRAHVSPVLGPRAELCA